MNKILFASTISLAVLLISCGGDKKTDNTASSEAKGGVYFGGVLRLNEFENIKSLIPIAINEQNSYHLSSQVYEGLVKFNQIDLTLIPGIARSWEVNTDQTEYVFHLRTNAVFHDDACFENGKGRAVTANDFKYCFDKLCSQDPNNNQFDITFKDRVLGATENFVASKTGKGAGVKGVTVINDSTLKIKLINADASFLNILALAGCYVYPKEAVTKYGNEMRIKTVGTGPFYTEVVKEGEVIIMKKNPNYWGYDDNGNRLPYLDGIKWTFIRDKKTEILEFKRGNLDVVYLIPIEMFSELMGKLENAKTRSNEFEITSSTALHSNNLGFNVQANTAFAKKEVRLAFNYAIDRHKIADYTIQGEGTAADYGIVPYIEAFEKDGYPYKKLRGYTFDPIKAKELLKAAGYPNGKGFPEVTLEINSGGGDRNILVAEVVKSMLEKNLKVKININTVPFPEHIDNIQSGKTNFFRYGWFADYPDPETFLTIFLGSHVPNSLQEKSYINFSRYKNPRFDSLFLAARLISDKARRFEMLAEAEQIILDDAPVMPIFYDENFRLEQKGVRNLPENPKNYMDMTTTYIIPKDKLKK